MQRISARALSTSTKSHVPKIMSGRVERSFIEVPRAPDAYRPPTERIQDWHEINTTYRAPTERKAQAGRCMDCGTPFCQSRHLSGCPVANLIPEWNALVYRDEWREAYLRLSATNNFPEFTGRVCPAPCEGACVAGLVEQPVTIKNIEYAIVDRAWDEGWVTPRLPVQRTGLNVAVVGSGPAGLAAADELNQMGHTVTVFEREDRIGGLLMYGIPNMKLEKSTVDRRVQLLHDEGITFRTNVDVGSNVRDVLADMDAVVLCTGSSIPRFADVPGKDLSGVHFAMEFLTSNQKRLLASKEGTLKSRWNKDWINAEGKDVVVIGGGDTGTDCIATALRHRCRSVVNLEHNTAPPEARSPANPWPQYPKVYGVDYGHAEVRAVFGEDPRQYERLTLRFEGDDAGRLTHVVTARSQTLEDGTKGPIPGTEETFPCDLAILAMGFLHPDQALPQSLQLQTDTRKNIWTDNYATSMPGVFAAGDCRRGQSLVVWAIHEGRDVAQKVQQYFVSEGLADELTHQ
ncbi:hypothetical protein H257_14596 [Aphanomyces astaci]|uniref:4Fe-4S ferredoxin-type domain-containing protein n=2 Tax=Aphanomyces astaci TaxID=112090 RepID=W4FQJ5_APHAT|nr:hypothetical protein H257_14596 [Aphanomyces astaci]ETV69757.1 hypothetical protein H257_14596 [Aphanomyces astaci]|eukprot:XP_009840771.1 hypothetical protein H257_14596 [Aphanomyces astaci]